MEIRKGTNRLVLIFDQVVVKFPLVKIMRGFKEFCYREKKFFKLIQKHDLKKHYLKKLTEKEQFLKDEKEFIARKSKQLSLKVLPKRAYETFGIRYSLFGGIMANWNEYLFYQKTRNPFLMPTYFSLFGLINIQKKSRKIDFWSHEDVWLYVCRNSINENQPFCDSHSFDEIENFGLDGDKLRMHDYGSRHIREFLRLNGENLFNNFTKPSV